MGSSKRDGMAAAKEDVAAVISRSMRAIKHGIGKRSSEDIKAAFELPMAEAPAWAHAAIRMAGTHITVQGQSSTPQTGTQLQVVVMNNAPSIAAWQAQADQFKQLPGVQAVIDIPVEEPVEVEK